jgi:hypothetical protein
MKSEDSDLRRQNVTFVARNESRRTLFLQDFQYSCLVDIKHLRNGGDLYAFFDVYKL